MSVDFGRLTAAMIDRAIKQQESLQFDREKFAQVLTTSDQMWEYINLLCREGTRDKAAAIFGSALALGIEIGVALESLYGGDE